MSGGQGDAPPPLNGGHFLLELLQNPPQHKRTHSQPPAPSTTLPNDPAVAAIGPTLPFPSSTFFPPSNGHNNSPYHHQQLAPPPLWPPHHQSTPLPFAPHVFFSQNQNPNPNLNPNPGFSSSLPLPLPLPQQAFNQAQSQQRNIQMNLTPHGGDDIQKLGFLGVNPKPNLNGENLFFGSLHSENRNFSTSMNGKVKEGIAQPGQFEGLDRLGLQNLEAAFHNSLNLDRDSRQIMPGLRANEQERSNDRGSRSGYGNQVQSGSYKTLLPPPGFMRSNVNNEFENRRNLEQIINKGKSNLMELNHRNGNSKQYSHGNSILDANERETGHDFSDLEEKQELDDLSTEKNDKGKHHARDKDYRCDLRGNKVLSQKNRILRKQIQCRLDIEYMNAGFLGIYKSLIPADEEKAKQKQLFNMLQNHISEEWPNARLFVYGSCDNMFGFSKSDLDVCLEFKDIDVNKTDVLLKLAEILKAKNLEDVQAFTRARVPIVKFMDPETKIWCDICINNTLAEINTKLLRDYAKIDDRVRQLAFLVKHWAKCRGVNETYQGTLSSYAYVIMCIYFLQQRKPAILPCLQEMEPTFSRIVDDVEYAFFDQVEKLNGFGRDSQNVENISKLLWGFFRYWAYCHDYRDDVISVRTLYKMSKRAKEWTRRIGNDRHLICIEDPFETTHDLGRVVDWNSIRVLKEEFERAAYIMQNHPDPCVELFKSYNSNSKRN